MTDTRKFLPDIKRWEGVVPWLYRDSLGYGTIGIGFLVRDIDEAIDLPLQNFTEDRVATDDEKRREFTRVMSCQRGLRAGAYRAVRPPRIEMPAAAVEARALKRLATEFLPGIMRLMPGFEGFPEPAQAVIVDMAWNLGIGRPATADHKASGLTAFGALRESCNRGDWAEAAQHCHVATSRPERNDWRADRFAAALVPG
jgi:GH24 family phage-related lysozyme (muramidase)